jgi:hypothetical protein
MRRGWPDRQIWRGLILGRRVRERSLQDLGCARLPVAKKSDRERVSGRDFVAVSAQPEVKLSTLAVARDYLLDKVEAHYNTINRDDFSLFVEGDHSPSSPSSSSSPSFPSDFFPGFSSS